MSAKSVKQKTIKKKLPWLKISGGLIVLILGVSLFMPQSGTERFGLCRIFLELNVPYPLTLRLLQVEETATNVDIIYSDLDGFGYESISKLRCKFGISPKGEKQMVDFQFDDYKRDPVEKAETLKHFNAALPTMLLTLPDLTYPDPISEDIAEYRAED